MLVGPCARGVMDAVMAMKIQWNIRTGHLSLPSSITFLTCGPESCSIHQDLNIITIIIIINIVSYSRVTGCAAQRCEWLQYIQGREKSLFSC